MFFRTLIFIVAFLTWKLCAETNYRWYDGSITSESELPGCIISDNNSFWGNNTVITGVKYSFKNFSPVKLDGRFDINEGLTDGRTNWGIYFPASKSEKLPAIVFDFKNVCEFKEIDVFLNRHINIPLKLIFKISNDQKNWNEIKQQQIKSDKHFFRTKLPEKSKGRFFSIESSSSKSFGISEVVIWGEAKPSVILNSGIPTQLQKKGTVLKLKSLEHTPKIDGKPDSSELEQLQSLNFSRLGRKIDDELTKAFVGLTPDGIYICFECKEQNLEKRFYKDISGVGSFSDDIVEVFFNRENNDAKRYYHFGLTSNGKLLSDNKRVIDPTVTGKPLICKAAVAESDQKWYAEWLIPVQDWVGKNKVKSENWIIALTRSRRIKSTEGIEATHTSWPLIMAGTFHSTDFFAILENKDISTKNTGLSSFPGMESANFTSQQLESWLKNIGEFNKLKAIWSQSKSLENTSGPVFPERNKINSPVSISMFRNETENIGFYLTNPSPKPVEIKIEVDSPKVGVKTELLAAGIVYNRRKGKIFRPLFSEENLLNKNLLQNFVVNSKVIEDFPILKLGAYESAKILLNIKTKKTKPGKYFATLKASSGSKVRICIDVKDALLSRPEKYYYNTWGSYTKFLFPVYPENYYKKEEQYRYESGINVYRGIPDEIPIGMDALRRHSNMFYFWGTPEKYVHLGYCDRLKVENFTRDDKSAILNFLKEKIKHLKKLGLTKDRWMLEIWDEPGIKDNVKLMEAIVKLIKDFDPEINIYCNPCCWTSTGYASEEKILQVYRNWYNKYVDVSVPIKGLLFGYKGRKMDKLEQLWLAPRKYNAYFTHPCPGRQMPWNAFKAGLNGWGYYSYYSPRGNPWNDYDSNSFDYQVIYPGKTAPVLTITSELMREGWEDYCMLKMLKKQKRNEILNRILNSEKGFNNKRRQLIKAIIK